MRLKVTEKFKNLRFIFQLEVQLTVEESKPFVVSLVTKAIYFYFVSRFSSCNVDGNYLPCHGDTKNIKSLFVLKPPISKHKTLFYRDNCEFLK